MPKSKYTKEQLATAIATANSMRQLMLSLGMSDAPGNYKRLRVRALAMGLDISRLLLKQEQYNATRQREAEMRNSITREQLEAVTKNSVSCYEALRNLGLVGRRTDMKWFKAITKELNIETKHLKRRLRPLEEMLC